MRGLGAERLIAALRGGEPALDRDDCERAFTEGLAPQLGAALRGGRLRVPDEMEARLLRAHRRCMADELIRDQTTLPVLEALAKVAIPTLLLKGAAMSRVVYRQPGLRPMVDIDLLVPAARFDDAIVAATSAGARTIDAPTRPLTMHLYHEVHLAIGTAQIDLHRALAPWPLFRFDHDRMFARAQQGPDGLLVPSPADLLVHLATHAAGDGFLTDLRAVLDGLLLLDRLAVAPAEVVALAAEWRARRAVAAFLVLLSRFGIGSDWVPAIAALGQGAASRRLAADALLGDTSHALLRWRRRWRLLRAVDGAVRPAAFLGVRGALLVGDLLWRAGRARA